MLMARIPMSKAKQPPPSHRAPKSPADGTREKLMDLAEQVSANKGPDDVTLDDVAHRAGMPLAQVIGPKKHQSGNETLSDPAGTWGYALYH